MHYILCKDNNWTTTLEKEVKADFSKDVQIVAGLPLIKIPSKVNLENGYIAFSTAILPNCLEIPADSVSVQTKQIAEFIKNNIHREEVEKSDIEASNISPDETTDTATQLVEESSVKEKREHLKFNFHTFALTEKYGIIETGRAEIFKEKTTKLLKQAGMFALRKGFDRELGLLQVMTLADRSLAVSYIPANKMSKYRSLVSPFIGGFNNVADDKAAPSRAFKKLVEAQIIMAKPIMHGELLVDLGASPGGWTYVARKRGAMVIAIDRSPLQKELMEDRDVKFMKADAFKYQPNQKIDWVVSDIISTPDRVLELIEHWVIGENCQHFVFTVKFQGQRDYGVLKKFKDIGRKAPYHVILKQLNANKNEVTIMGSIYIAPKI